MKILLLGKNGQVGHELQRSLLLLGQVIAYDRQQADLENTDGLLQVLNREQPNVIVNAAAYTAVDKAESEPAKAFLINAAAVQIMAEYAHKHNVLLVHYSTDYVFDGTKQDIYVEEHACNPQNVYGASKRAGEQFILDSQCPAFIFRTSWVVSSHGNNFIKTILRLAKERTNLNIVDDQWGAPTSAEMIADVTALAIYAYHRHEMSSGIYHLVANGEVTWYGLAKYVVAQARKQDSDIMLSLENINPISTEQYPLPAKRPKNSRMSVSKLQEQLSITIPDWRVYVDRIIQQL